jgi:hypothetical protein
LVLLFSFEVPLKKYQKNIQQKEKKRKTRDNIEGALCVCFFSFVWWCFVITFVSRLASLAQSSLGPEYYHRLAISQLAFVANMVLVLPYLLLSTAYSSTYIPHCSLTGILVPALIHPLQGC